MCWKRYVVVDTHTQHTYVTWLQIWTYVCVYAAHVLLRNFNLVEKSGMWDRLLFLRKVLLLVKCLIAVCNI